MNKEQKKNERNEIYAIRRVLLKKLVHQYEGKKKDIADALGLPVQGHLSRFYTTGKGLRNITDDVAEKAEYFFKLPAGWLSNPANLTPEQRQFLDLKTIVQTTPPTAYTQTPIPLLTSDNVMDYLNNPKSVGVREYTSSMIYHSHQAIAVMMPDQSMCNPSTTPSLCKDDILIIEPNITPISGDIVFIFNVKNQNSMFAQLSINTHGSSLKHTNPEMDTPIQLTEQTEIIGVVIERQTRLYSQASLSQRINF